MRDIYRIVRLLGTFATILFSANCFANPDRTFDNGPRWACWYSPTQLTIQCLLIRAPGTGHSDRAAEVASRIDRRLPELVKMIWGSPERLAGTPIGIPLMNVPFDMEFVELLAKSVMCGRWKDCSIHFDQNSDGQGAIRAMALESGASEPEILAEMNAQKRLPPHPEPISPSTAQKRIRGMANS